MLLLAAFQILLARYTNQKDILVGSPIANRTRAELEHLIGFFANTLVLRTTVTDNPRLRELLQRVRATTLDAYAHQDLPFEKLVEELQPERDLSHNPLFQVMFVMQNVPEEALPLPGITWQLLKIKNDTAKFDLTLEVAETAQGLEGRFEYNTDLFTEQTIGRMAKHWQNLLESIAENLDQRISDLTLLSATERQQILKEWNNTQAIYPKTHCIHELIEQQVERSPEGIAAIYEGETLTYRELNQRANSLAHYLRSRGVGPDVLVGICVERSFTALVGLLGILKAGGAYVPLDPAYPPERLAFMLNDTNIPVLLTHQRFRKSFTQQDMHIICLDDNEWVNRDPQIINVPNINVPENLAYVIYTSGSTGQPKGVCLPHRALVNLLDWHKVAYPGKTKTIQFASLSFDASFFEIFATWYAGGSVFLISEEVRKDNVQLANFIVHAEINKLMLPVVVVQQLAEEYCYRQQFFTDMKEFISIGEQMHITQPIIEFFKHAKNCSLLNYYGPSESHAVTTLKLNDNPESWSTHPPIGYPIANSQIYLLDDSFQPVPVGVAGELYIGGDCLARGYLHRPALTAERFMPDPFGEVAGSRLYKTGDLACYRPDGAIEYLGRRDTQVKLRGYRIELEEIEAVLTQHQAVQEAVVVVRGSDTDEKRIVAYVVMHQEQTSIGSELRNYLKAKLPEYMVPANVVPLQHLPLNPNGKIDRAALPTPERERAGTLVIARTPYEEKLATIWCRLFGLQAISMHDNFFELGGHSLLVTQLHSRIRDTFGVELPLYTLFGAPTVAGQAEIIEVHQLEQTNAERRQQLVEEIGQLSEEELDRLLELEAEEE